ncbi:uncharacterized protein [Triticum aestivum]|uniref:uncharacterized protein n=1 Tax=Triticum aestivum TaxID=4565 RepID=UPI001D02C1EE|nr:uncharacterized protein LOC123106257 [Triticum aestivum]
MKWSIGEVVGVEHAVAFETMPVLCFHPPRREPPRRGFSLLASSWARAASTMRCSSSWTSASASSSSSAASASSSSESITEAGKSPNTLRPVGVSPPLNCPSAAGNGGRKRPAVVGGAAPAKLCYFSGVEWLSSGERRRSAPGYSYWRPRARAVGGESGKKTLTFPLTAWASRAFPLRRSPQLPPSAPGSACDRRAEKRAEPAFFDVLEARLGRFFGAGAEKVAYGPVGDAAGDALSIKWSVPASVSCPRTELGENLQVTIGDALTYLLVKL